MGAASKPDRKQSIRPPGPSVSQPLDLDAFRLLVESTLDYAIFMLDPEGRVASWNAGAQRIKQYAADEIIGRHFSTFYPPDAIARDWPQTELAIAAREGRFEDEGWRLRKDGTRFWANVIITALRGPDGGLRGYAKVTRDITERRVQQHRIENLTRQLERRVEELAAANRELEQKSAENESFVYSVSHDLRTPLVNLQGFSQELTLTTAELKALLEGPGVEPGVRDRGRALIADGVEESLAFIRTAVQHLGRIIDGLLRLSRLGRVQYEAVPVDVGEVVREITGAMHGTVARSGARVDCAPLPVVRGDRNAIGQIFANLIGNALKSFDPSRPGHLEIGASADDPPVFAVRDNGVGIPVEYRGKIFQVFQRVHARQTQGEGMGLAIVRRIVERHGGRIWFESEAGRGTTFYFTLAPQPPAPGSQEAGA
jgi:PAS domain S-box-containing protein